ncbi:MAG TPA: urate hydroxylase PuuD [Micropepsaceae bacterium]|nr:urate hydroxylase PuuD [Micropepsaceae bacterium]
MASILSNLYRMVTAGFVLAIVLFAVVMALGGGDYGVTLGDRGFWSFVFRWLHVLAGIMWIGHLYYFNFVQMIQMPKIPDEQKPAVSKFIAPEALWWFRWAAMATIATGLVLAWLNYYLVEALSLGALGETSGTGTILIGVGMWLGTIMWFNVWFIIWPNQQKALNIENRYPSLSKEQKAAAGRTAMLVSRTNAMLSVPMLFAMVGAQNLGL